MVPVADDVGAACAVLDVSVGHLVPLAASKGLGHGLEGQRNMEVVSHFVFGLWKARHVYKDVEFGILKLFLQLETSCVLMWLYLSKFLLL